MWRAPEATALGPSEWIAKLSCVVAPQATMTVAGALLFDPQHVGIRGRWLFHHQHSIFNPQFFDFPATTELSVGKSFGCHEPELVSIIRNFSCPKCMPLANGRTFFRSVSQSANSIELLVEHWSSLVNGASVDSRQKRSRKLKGPQNYFELVGQFEAL